MRKLFFLFICCFTGYFAIAQMQLGIFGGIANYQGDLVENAYQSPRPAIGITLGYELNSRINIRAGLIFAKVAGADSLSESASLRARNLSFQSNITELSLTGQFNTFDMNYKSWSPYLFAGIALYRHNPFTFDENGNKVFLQPLSTEGQGITGYPQSKPYSLIQLAIPFGGGIKYNISENTRISLEIGIRKLFTDYLDDVSGNYADAADLLAEKGQLAVDLSYRGDEIAEGNPAYPLKGVQRGSPKYKDYYYFTGLHISFRLPEGRNGSRAAKKSGYGCPTVF